MKYLKTETATRKGKVCSHWNPGKWTIRGQQWQCMQWRQCPRYSRKQMTTARLAEKSLWMQKHQSGSSTITYFYYINTLFAPLSVFTCQRILSTSTYPLPATTICSNSNSGENIAVKTFHVCTTVVLKGICINLNMYTHTYTHINV